MASPQFVYYDDGVGVSQGVADDVTHLLGGALGQGLDYKITRAYEFLCLNYEPGDRIFIFGFSRGAYTARSLAGLLRQVWILKREEATHVFDAMSLYRTRARSTDPQAAQDTSAALIAKFRADHCYPAESFKDVQAYVPGEPASLEPDGQCAWIQYVGVWDTVGSLGVPRNLPFSAQLDVQYQFYDTNLSRFVRSARHAVSVDERRDTFKPTLWSNIGAMNDNAMAGGLAYVARPYQQTWFPGGHGCVGGGSDDGGVSIPPMLWVAEGAARAGLTFDVAELALYAQGAHPEAKFQTDGFSIGTFAMQLGGMSDRDGPDVLDEVSLSARLRWNRLAAYRPAPLTHAVGLEADLDNWAAPADPQIYFAP